MLAILPIVGSQVWKGETNSDFQTVPIKVVLELLLSWAGLSYKADNSYIDQPFYTNFIITAVALQKWLGTNKSG